MLPELRDLQAALDCALVGHDDAKTGVLLALLAREHAYLEGPPGCGKSRLARAAAAAAGARMAEVSFHRDLREGEWLGDAILRRRPHGRGERIAREVVPGPALRAEVLVLDDVSRAPAPALGPLLPLLGERRAHGRAIPLETAIATAPSPGIAVYGDPLEPGLLDRFTVRIRMRGVLTSGALDLARTVLASRADVAEPPAVRPLLDAPRRHALQARAATLSVGDEARRGLTEFGLRVARLLAGSAPAGGLSDRAFARGALAVMRAHALLRGGDRVEARDLLALRFLLARRVPEGVFDEACAIVDELAHRRELFTAVHAEAAQSGAPRIDAGGSSRAAEGVDAARHRDVSLPRVRARMSDRVRPGGDADLSRLLRAIEGRIERGGADREEHPGGAPRRQRRMRGLGEIQDADLLEAVLFAQGGLPGEPRVHRRERRDAAGAMAVLRDVSASMEGRLSAWTGEVVAGLVRMIRRRRMRMGYIEFHHEAERFLSEGRFFHRDCEALLALAARRRAEGRTSYEAPLRAALDAFRGVAHGRRHIVLLTDGVPVAGDPWVERERALARRCGVAVHTVFVGLGECPPVLDALSLETRGLRLRAIPRAGGRLEVREREPLARARRVEACA